MKPTTVLTLAVFCTLYTIATAASIPRDGDLFSLTGDELRELAQNVDRNSAIQSLLKRNNEGCSGFGGCAHLTVGHNAVRMIADNNSPFGVGGPGKRRRSVDAVANQKA